MKSHVRSLLELAHCVYRDACAKCTMLEPDFRDLETLRKRVENEGLSFLTITLPTLGSDFEKSLDAKQIVPTLFRAFRKRGKAPALLQGFFALVFDMGTGGLLHEPSVAAIEGIRQISYLFKKLQVPCAPKRVAKALTKFTECERVFNVPVGQADINDFVNVSNCLWSSILTRESLRVDRLIPKHGPGATAEKLSGNAKFRLKRWHSRLEPYFPIFGNLFHSETVCFEPEFQRVSAVKGSDEQPVRVIAVPKTLKGPRIIAIEPVCMQYTQQAIGTQLVKELKSSKIGAGHIDLTRQETNRQMALISSKDGKFATLDLSSASDRVPHSLAMRMFDCNPLLQGAIEACRSRSAQVSDSEVITLKKFASMGSALCFPVEAMYFYTICVVALIKKHNLPVTYRNVFAMSRYVYVYGDDIIVPTDSVEIVVEHLQKYYCKVNTDKSFWNGNFRESCGQDAFKGESVTPTYVRELRPLNKRSPSALISWVKSSNLFYERGYWLTSSHMLSVCENILGELPVVGKECAGLGKVSFQRYVSQQRWGRRYHIPEVRAWVPSPVYREDKLEGYAAMTKCLLKLETPLSPGVKADAKHLSRTARHGAVTLKRRWIRPY